MTKTGFTVVICLLLVFAILGCEATVSDELKEDEIMGAQPDAKVTEDVTADVENESDGQWDIREISVREDWNDLKVEILGLGLGKGLEDGDELKDAVSLKFRIENTRADGGGELVTYPDQATLITSTGEQLEPDMWAF